ncbi:MAG: hypothetical protein ACW98X_25730 [Promethearchaeota archaeon]|jgi:hypothetical protein
MTTLSVLVDLMKQVGENKNTTGKQKKEWVINKMKEVLNLPDVVEELIAELIDLLVDVDGHKIVINPKVKKHFINITSLCC